ncbi:MAG: putative Ig domain-containing protein [Pseudomonadota bacterium]
MGDFFVSSATLSNGAPLPDWLVFRPGANDFHGTPSAQDVGTLDLIITATDRSGAKTSIRVLDFQ